MSPMHPLSISVTKTIKEVMMAKNICSADIAETTHLTKRALNKKLSNRSLLRMTDMFAIARALDVNPSLLFSAIKDH